MPSIRSMLLSLAARGLRGTPGRRRRWKPSSASENQDLVLRLRLVLGDQGAADGHDEGDDAVDPLGGLVLGRLELAGGIPRDGDVGGRPAAQDGRCAQLPKARWRPLPDRLPCQH
jgi:hypothetical protein